MDRLVVIANPVASQFTGGSHRDVMAALSKSHDVEALWPSSAPDATEAARSAVQSGVGTVVAMGGDGMVHHVAQAVVGTEAALGIIPVGTTNVVARLFGIPSRPARAARLIAGDPAPAAVGVAKMTLGRGATETTHYALFACGFGLDAEVVAEADKDPYRKYRFGSIHYARTALSVGLRDFPSREPHLDVTAGDMSSKASALLVQFRETYTYFGRIPVKIGTADPNPMTLLVLEGLKRRRAPAIALNALTRRDLGAVEGIDVWSDVESAHLEASPPVVTQADGESLGLADAATISWHPKALKIIGHVSPPDEP